LLGLEVLGGFAGVGVEAEAPADLTLSGLAAQVGALLGASPRVQPGGPPQVKRVAVVSGRVPHEIATAARAGFDTLLTGEPLHDFFHDPAEYGINVIYAGHYATEKVGLDALARHLEAQFGLETLFIDVPTGL